MGNRITCWLDPGKTTGIACWDSRDGGTFTSVEAPDITAAGYWLELLVLVNEDERAGGSLIIELGWEKYTVTPGNARLGTAYWSLEVIGAARYLALKHGMIILPPQLSSMMAVSTDARLKLAGWHKPGKPHANDAARHLLRYCIKMGILPFEIWNKIFTESVLNDE